MVTVAVALAAMSTTALIMLKICICSASEVKKISEIFSRMFNDPSAKVFTIFLETLPSFVTSHADDIPTDWLYVCLSRLLARLSVEQFSSVLNRLNKVFNAVR